VAAGPHQAQVSHYLTALQVTIPKTGIFQPICEYRKQTLANVVCVQRLSG
tara:strand:+ start:42 stop:191 length:150 start_codon:yes stop_codon:yes gene_type:complete